MGDMRSEEEKPPDPAAARVVARVRWLMLISAATTIVAVVAVVVVIGYRLFRSEGSAGAAGPPAEVTALLPKGARVIVTALPEDTALLPKGARVTATALAEDRLVVTIETAGGGTEIRTFDLKTLRPLGRLRFAIEP